MKQAKNCIIIYDMTSNDYKIIANKNKRTIIKTLLIKLEKDHDIRISPALYTSEEEDYVTGL